MERVQNTILLHGVAYVQHSIAPDTTRCTRGEARSFFCIYKTYLYAQNYFRKNKFKYCFKSYIKLHEYANCNSANYDV